MGRGERDGMLSDDASGEERIAALREEIRRAGERIYRARRRTFMALQACMLLAAFVNFVAVGSAESGGPGWPLSVVLRCVIVWAIGMVGLFPTLAACRAWRTKPLRAGVGLLPPEDQTILLHSLQSEPVGDTRLLARAVARRLNVPTEIIPAVAPDARGDEASPAENER